METLHTQADGGTAEWQPGRAGWIVLTAAGLAMGLPLGIASAGPLEPLVGAALVTPLMLGIAGVVLGTAQWWLLRHRLERAWVWIAGTAAGLSLGMTTGVVLVETVGRALTGEQVRLAGTGFVGLVVSMIVLGVAGGLLIGAAQAFHLRTVGLRARGWTLANAAGLAGAWTGGLVVATVVLGGLASAAGAVVFLATSGLLYGLVTAAALARV